jgi:hypothetical protein
LVPTFACKVARPGLALFVEERVCNSLASGTPSSGAS